MEVKPPDRPVSAPLVREAPPTSNTKAQSDAAREQTLAAKEAQPAHPPAAAAAAASSNTNLRFSVDKDSGKTVVAWVDDSGKVLRQMPSEEALAVAKAIDRYQGVFLNRKA